MLPPPLRLRRCTGFFSVLLVVFASGTCLAADFPIAAPAAVRTDNALGRTVNVREFGAMGDGRSDDTAALQRALEGGRRTVVIPTGTYLIRAALRLDSETILRADPQAIIRLADGAGNSVDVFLLRNRDETAGNHDLVIEGGIWDGNNEHNPRGAAAQMPCYTGVAFHFANVQRLAMRNLVIRNPETYAFRAIRLSDFVIEHVGFDNRFLRENQDGIHLNGHCERGVIRDLAAVSHFATNDDMVALNADDGDGTAFVSQQGMISGPIRDIVVQHLRAPSAFSFVRLLSSEHSLENIRIEDVAGGCRFYAVNMDRWRFPPGGGKIRRVTLRNFSVHKAFDSFSRQSRAAQRPLVLMQTAVEDFRLENFGRTDVAQPAAVTLRLDNGQRNRVRLAGLSAGQAQAIRTASPAIPAQAFGPSSPGALSGQSLQFEATAELILPSGGFSLLEINPTGAPPTR